MKKKLPKVKKLLEEKNSFVLICHTDPDGDALGSMLALGTALESQKKVVTYICRDEIPPVFAFIANKKMIQKEFQEAEVIILLDNGDGRRTGFMPDLTRAKKEGSIVVNIDHHIKNDLWNFSTVNYANPELSSTSEIIFNLLNDLDLVITPDIATYLLCGIYNDTGGFKHSNTSNQVLSISSDLLKKGARLKKIAENIENSQPISKFKLWGKALGRMRINKYGISVSVLTRDDIAEARATEDDVSGLVNLLNSAPESKASLLLYEAEDDKIKGSLRSERNDIDLALLARQLGGGGHKKAAGFTISGKIQIHGDDWKIE